MEHTISIAFFLRHLRIRHGNERLYEMALKLDVSSAYLSTIENGKRQPSDTFIDRLEKVYHLKREEVIELKMMRDYQATQWRIDPLIYNREQRQVLLHLIHKIDGFTPQKIKQLKKFLDL